jgi:hypothetical protein
VGSRSGAVFARFAGHPLGTPFAVFLVVLLLEAIAVSLVPETVERREERPAYRPQRLSLPPAARSEFTGAAIGVFGAFAISGLFMALAPALLAHELHQPSRLLAGIAPFTMLGSAALAQLASARLGTRPQLRSGYVLMAVGLVLLAVAAFTASLPLFFGASVLAGAGFGLGFRASVGTVAALADDLTRGEVLAALFLAAYAGLVLPVLLVGLAMLVASGAVVLAGFVVLELALLGWSARRTLART